MSGDVSLVEEIWSWNDVNVSELENSEWSECEIFGDEKVVVFRRFER